MFAKRYHHYSNEQPGEQSRPGEKYSALDEGGNCLGVQLGVNLKCSDRSLILLPGA